MDVSGRQHGTSLGVEIDGNHALAVTMSDGVVVQSRTYSAVSGVGALQAALEGARVRSNVRVVVSGTKVAARYLNVAATVNEPAALDAHLHHALSVPDTWLCSAITDPARDNEYALAVATDPAAVLTAYEVLASAQTSGEVVSVPACLPGLDSVIVRVGRRSVDVTIAASGSVVYFAALATPGTDAFAARIGGSQARERFMQALDGETADPVLRALAHTWCSDLASEVSSHLRKAAAVGAVVPQRIIVVGDGAGLQNLTTALDSACSDREVSSAGSDSGFVSLQAARSYQRGAPTSAYPRQRLEVRKSIPRSKSSFLKADRYRDYARALSALTGADSTARALSGVAVTTSEPLASSLRKTAHDLDSGTGVQAAVRHLPADLAAWVHFAAVSPRSDVSAVGAWVNRSAAASLSSLRLFNAPVIAAAFAVTAVAYLAAGVLVGSLVGVVAFAASLAAIFAKRRSCLARIRESSCAALLATDPAGLPLSVQVYLAGSYFGDSDLVGVAAGLAQGKGVQWAASRVSYGTLDSEVLLSGVADDLGSSFFLAASSRSGEAVAVRRGAGGDE